MVDYDIANPLGREFTAIVKGVEKSDLSNLEKIKSAMDAAARAEGLSVLKFGTNQTSAGATIVAILNRSHIMVHTFPEFRTMYVSIYTSKGPREGGEMLKKMAMAFPHSDVVTSDRRIDLLASSNTSLKFSSSRI